MTDKVTALCALIDGLDVTKAGVLIEEAEQAFMEYCARDDIPEAASMLVVQLAVLRYNRLGAEGLSSQSYSGTSESYVDGLPADIKKRLNRYRRLLTL